MEDRKEMGLKGRVERGIYIYIYIFTLERNNFFCNTYRNRQKEGWNIKLSSVDKPLQS